MSGGDPHTARDAFQQALIPPEASVPPAASVWRTWSKRILFSAWGQAVVGALVVTLVLVLLNPPMVQSKSHTDIEQPARDWRKILVGAGVTAGLVVLVPFVYRQMQKHT